MTYLIALLLWIYQTLVEIKIPPVTPNLPTKEVIEQPKTVLSKGGQKDHTTKQVTTQSEYWNEIFKYEDWRFLRRVFALESSGGKRDSCQAVGKYNSMGYASNRVCFDSPAEAVERVNRWKQENCKGLTESQCLCGYNLGFGGGHKKCTYSEARIESYPENETRIFIFRNWRV